MSYRHDFVLSQPELDAVFPLPVFVINLYMITGKFIVSVDFNITFLLLINNNLKGRACTHINNLLYFFFLLVFFTNIAHSIQLPTRESTTI